MMLSALAKRLGSHLGLQPLPSWEQELGHKLRTLSAERSMKVEDLVARIDVDPLLLREVAASLTVNETYFLRESRHFDAAVAHIVPRAERGGVVAWSAGCSSGEEPYSLAILLTRRARHLMPRVQIRGNDLSGDCLNKARRGVYGAWSFRSAPPWLRTEYFNPVGTTEWKLDERIVERVEFHQETIQASLNRTLSDSIDLIFYRNVSIYSEPAALEVIFAGFHRVLKSDGLLIQSVSDVRPPQALFDIAPAPVLGLFAPRKAPLTPLRESSRPRPVRDSAFAARNQDEPLPPPVPKAPVITVSEPPPKPAPTVPSTAELLQTALEHGDSGKLDAALEVVGRVLSDCPESIDARFLRGKLLVAASRYDDAVVEFRKVVFLRPNHRLSRYWLAMAYLGIHMPKKAVLELAELARRLGQADPMDALEDGATRVEELLAAVDEQQRILQ